MCILHVYTGESTYRLCVCSFRFCYFFFCRFNFHNFCCCAHIYCATVFIFLPLLLHFFAAMLIFILLLFFFFCCFVVLFCFCFCFFSDALWKLNFPLTFFGQSSKLSAKNYGLEECVNPLTKISHARRNVNTCLIVPYQKMDVSFGNICVEASFLTLWESYCN